MMKDYAVFGEYLITRDENNSITVLRKFGNVKDSLRTISEEIGFEYENTWTTRQFGGKLIKNYGSDKIAFINNYVVRIDTNGSVRTQKVYDNTKAALREISEKANFEYNKDWNVHNFGRKLIHFIKEKQLEHEVILDEADDEEGSVDHLIFFVDVQGNGDPDLDNNCYMLNNGEAKLFKKIDTDEAALKTCIAEIAKALAMSVPSDEVLAMEEMLQAKGEDYDRYRFIYLEDNLIVSSDEYNGKSLTPEKFYGVYRLASADHEYWQELYTAGIENLFTNSWTDAYAKCKPKDFNENWDSPTIAAEYIAVRNAYFDAEKDLYRWFSDLTYATQFVLLNNVDAFSDEDDVHLFRWEDGELEVNDGDILYYISEFIADRRSLIFGDTDDCGHANIHAGDFEKIARLPELDSITICGVDFVDWGDYAIEFFQNLAKVTQLETLEFDSECTLSSAHIYELAKMDNLRSLTINASPSYEDSEEEWQEAIDALHENLPDCEVEVND